MAFLHICSIDLSLLEFSDIDVRYRCLSSINGYKQGYFMFFYE